MVDINRQMKRDARDLLEWLQIAEQGEGLVLDRLLDDEELLELLRGICLILEILNLR